MWKGGSEPQLITPDCRDLLDPTDATDPTDPTDPRMNSFSLQVDVKMRSKSMAPSNTPRKVDSFYGNLYSAADVYQLFIHGIP